jgi:hypothetical protein
MVAVAAVGDAAGVAGGRGLPSPQPTIATAAADAAVAAVARRNRRLETRVIVAAPWPRWLESGSRRSFDQFGLADFFRRALPVAFGALGVCLA